MEAYAAKVGAVLHVVDSLEHVALREHKARLTAAPLMLRFLKLPLLEHFLGRYWQVLYLDDDTLAAGAEKCSYPLLFLKVSIAAYR